MSGLKQTLCNLINIIYYERDDSHGKSHIYKVRDNSVFILHNLNECEQELISLTNLTSIQILNIVEIAALFHDAWDHKYIENEEEIVFAKQFIRNHLKNYISNEHIDIIYDIIDNISFTKEKNDKKQNLGKYEILRTIVSDGDKLEALGNVAIERMITYRKHLLDNGKNLENDLITHMRKHCQEKLFKLKDEYIHTQFGKELALPLHNELFNIVNDTRSLLVLIDTIVPS